MKKLLMLLFLFGASCGDSKQKDSDSNKAGAAGVEETLSLCFLSLGHEIRTENSLLRDSTVLNLEIQGSNVTGSLNWVPAEKDSRRGRISGTKEGKHITGSFSFVQEGIQDTLPIEIVLTETSALVTTNSGAQGEMKLEVSRLPCLD